MRVWSIGHCHLVDEGDRGFAVVDPAGAVVERYVNRSDSVEDELWTREYVVTGTRFAERTTCTRGWQSPETDEKTLLRWLIPTHAPDAHAHVAAALAADRKARDARAADILRERMARLAAIPGALTKHALGMELANAQRALQERVRRWDCARSAELLRLLGEVARARPPEAAVTAFADGCLHACFEPNAHTYPALDASTAASGPPSPLAARLVECAVSLDAMADGQEWADALRNAEAYRRAANALRHAARVVGENPAT